MSQAMLFNNDHSGGLVLWARDERGVGDHAVSIIGAMGSCRIAQGRAELQYDLVRRGFYIFPPSTLSLRIS